jgi:hypothetical protein
LSLQVSIQRSDGRPILSSGVVSGKESVLAIQRNRPDGSLDGIVVDLDTTVSQEDTEAVPVFGDVGKRFSVRRFASDAGAMMRQPGARACNQWR